jgi:hypothetical protein
MKVIPETRCAHKILYLRSGYLLIWLKIYLNDRRQFVFVNKELPDSCLVKAGVPQESVLDLLLFLLYSVLIYSTFHHFSYTT